MSATLAISLLALAGQQPVPTDTSAPRVASDVSAADSWPHWRGPFGTGANPAADPPTRWSEAEGVRWKVPLPGTGHSSPVVAGDLVFVTSAVPFGEHGDPVPDDAPGAHDNAPVTQQHAFVVQAYRRADGGLLWTTTVREQLPHAGAHVSGSLASASPVTDGGHVYAFFGSYGLYCIDTRGEIVWQRDLGDMQVKHGHGEGASPALHGDTIIVNWDHEGDSFIVALDKRDGTERWRRPRDEVTSWASPLIVEHGDRRQVIVSGTTRVRAYDLENGDEIWACGGLSHNVVASPVAADGMVYAASSYEKRALLAIRLEGAEGDLTGTDHVVWSRRRRTPYVPSPLLYGEWLYFLNHYQGVLTRVRARTGEEPDGPFRLPEVYELYASPVGAANRIYLCDRDGVTVVLSHGDDQPQIVAINRLDDSFSATPALAGRELYLRGRNLYCIAPD